MVPPLSKDERAELDAFRSDVEVKVNEIVDAGIKHVEGVVAPFAPLAVKVEVTAQKVEVIEQHVLEQKPILTGLKTEAGLAKKARVAAKKERVKRSTLDAAKREEEADELQKKRKREAEWRKLRRRVLAGLALLAGVGEVWHALFSGK